MFVRRSLQVDGIIGGYCDRPFLRFAHILPTFRHSRALWSGPFGDLAAVWSTLARLDVAGIVDEVAPRYANASASVGTYLALACANRIVDPCSKRGFADWW